jgi:hypothetical protein
MPLKLLYLGHLYLLLYLTVCLGAGFFLIERLAYFFWRCLVWGAQQSENAAAAISYLGPLLIDLCWLSLLPVLIVAVSGPVRMMWLKQCLASFALYGETVQGVGRAFRGLLIALRAAFGELVPLLAILVFYEFFSARLEVLQRGLFLSLVAAVGLLVMYKALPILMTPFLSILGKCPPEEALYYSKLITESKAPQLTGLAALTALAFWVFRLALPGFGMVYALPVFVALLWHLATLFAIVCMQALVEFVQLLDAQPPAPPQSSSPAPAQPLDVQITRAWIKD